MTSEFNFVRTPIEGLYRIDRKIKEDNRGYFSRFFCANEFSKIGLSKSIVQINHSYTQKKGTVRGLHYQYSPYTETKIVSCIRGEIFDVAVDLRSKSSTYLKWHAEYLSAKNKSSLYIPDGFAHGFQTLTDDCELIYLHTSEYMPGYEGGLNIYDKRISINWPDPVSHISERDLNHPVLSENFKGIDNI